MYGGALLPEGQRGEDMDADPTYGVKKSDGVKNLCALETAEVARLKFHLERARAKHAPLAADGAYDDAGARGLVRVYRWVFQQLIVQVTRDKEER
eukprot:7163394-Prymnesium_polylepis.1